MTLTFMRGCLVGTLLAVVAALPAAAQSVNTVSFRNDCSLPIKFAAHYTTPFDIVATSDLKTIEPGETIVGVKTHGDIFSYVAFDRHREWFGDTYRDVYVPDRRSHVPLPFRERTITGENSTQVISCKDSFGDDSKIQPRVYNACEGKGPIYIAMRYKSLDNEWKTFSWRKVEGREQADLPLTWNSIIYLFARLEAKDDGSIQGWGGSDAEFEIDGRTYGFMRKELTDETMIGFSC